MVKKTQCIGEIDSSLFYQTLANNLACDLSYFVFKYYVSFNIPITFLHRVKRIHYSFYKVMRKVNRFRKTARRSKDDVGNGI